MDEDQKLPEEFSSSAGELPSSNNEAQDVSSQESFESSQPTSMEAHHPHHIHHKKKWMDYLFEFFMLFLAVSSGFFVENLREHYVEHERANEYASMLHEDLVNDTLLMNIIIEFRDAQAKKYDTLKSMIDNIPFEKMDKQQFLRLANAAGDTRYFLTNNSTYQQLKSSGSLRYFKDTALVRILSTYEEDIKHGEFIQDEEKQLATNRIMPFKLQHFNMKLIDAGSSLVIKENFPAELFIDFDKKSMMEFYNLIRLSSWYNSFLSRPVFDPFKLKASKIIMILKKDYDLE